MLEKNHKPFVEHFSIILRSCVGGGFGEWTGGTMVVVTKRLLPFFFFSLESKISTV